MIGTILTFFWLIIAYSIAMFILLTRYKFYVLDKNKKDRDAVIRVASLLVIFLVVATFSGMRDRQAKKIEQTTIRNYEKTYQNNQKIIHQYRQLLSEKQGIISEYIKKNETIKTEKE